MIAKCIERHFKNAYISPFFFLPARQQNFQKSLKVEHVTGTSKYQNFQFAQFLCTYTLTAIIKWVKFKL